MPEIAGVTVSPTRIQSNKVSIAMAQVSAVATIFESRWSGDAMLSTGLGLLGLLLAVMLRGEVGVPGLAFLGGLGALFLALGIASFARQPHARTVIDTTTGSVVLLRSRKHADCTTLRDAIAAAMDERG